MKYRLFCTLPLVVLGTFTLATGPAQAQTTAPGPYYATPSWDQTIACPTTTNCPRFIVLSNMGGAAVLDRNTGLVWQRFPNTLTWNWYEARNLCIDTAIGNQKGWRLPSVVELSSLVDVTHNNPALPSGHPFLNVQSSDYWSATTNPDTPDSAWRVFFSNGRVESFYKSTEIHAWCVRGGMNADHY